MSTPECGLTIAICTRNRPLDLERCIRSLKCQEEAGEEAGVEVLVVDDGALEGELLQNLASALPSWMSFRHYRKEVQGLYRSLQEAVAVARYPVILFLDDDVEVEPTYINRLLRHYRENPELAGVGGVDRLTRSSRVWRYYARFFLFASGRPGKLSLGGFGGSMVTWPSAKQPFETEFLYGCNMSFRRSALKDLPDCEWMQGYSLASDFFLTRIAAQKGTVIVDPELGVFHHQAPQSRDAIDRVAETQIINHAHLVKQFMTGPWNKLGFYWTCLGLYLLTFSQGVEGKLRRRGFHAGLRQAWRILGDK